MLDRHSTCLYAIGADSGPVKIGVSRNVLKRLRALRSCTGRPLEVMAVMRCHRRHGERLQRALAADRVSGEWFEPSPRVLRAIELIGGSDVTELEAWIAENSKLKPLDQALAFRYWQEQNQSL